MDCEICDYLVTDLKQLNSSVVADMIDYTCTSDFLSNTTCSYISKDSKMFFDVFRHVLFNEDVCRQLGFCTRILLIDIFRHFF